MPNLTNFFKVRQIVKPMEADLVGIVRNSTDGYLNDFCTIKQGTQTTGIYGQPIESSVLVAINVPCRVFSATEPNSSTSGNVGDQNTMRDMYRVMLPSDLTPWLLIQNARLDVDQQMWVASQNQWLTIASVQGVLTDKIYQEAFITRQRGEGV